MMQPTFNVGNLQTYQTIFLVAVSVMFVVTVLVVISLLKARKDVESQLDMQKKQLAVFEEIRDLLKEKKVIETGGETVEKESRNEETLK
ncbi:MAG: hypothetical protein ACLFQV_10450 [Vulcanimicrobiota bacterium]